MYVVYLCRKKCAPVQRCLGLAWHDFETDKFPRCLPQTFGGFLTEVGYGTIQGTRELDILQHKIEGRGCAETHQSNAVTSDLITTSPGDLVTPDAKKYMTDVLPERMVIFNHRLSQKFCHTSIKEFSS